ncbi:hypothetical protein K2X89_13080 [Myxococcota bacterium]|nr:hypothetical protein [Myxococcota bacterium]
MRRFVSGLAVACVLSFASTAMATNSPSLPTGGRTLAGPGRATIAAGVTSTVYSQSAPNGDACTTVINGSRGSASVRITLVGPAASTVTFDVAAGATSSLCHDGVVRLDLTCLAETTCSAQWRVDEN